MTPTTPTGRRTVSGRRQIHRYIRILLSMPRPPLAPLPSDLRPDSGSTSSKRRKTSQDDDGGGSSCRIERNVNESLEEEDEAALGRDSVQGSPEPAVAATPDVPVRTKTAVANVTVGDADALECGVCSLALRPPIFQCEVGHVVCSACREKLEATGNGVCHVCGVATRGAYRRCHAIENLVDCIRVPCPYAAHGCDATPPYHGQESHCLVCTHAPCHCPGESCGFIGSMAALLDHIASAHNWPCTTKVRAREKFSICLRDGFNFCLLEDHGDGDDVLPLFLLNVTRERLGRAISVLCIHPHASAAAKGAQQLPLTQCELVFSQYRDRNLCHRHYQSSVFKVMFTDLSNGLPNPEDCFQFLVPNAVLEVGGNKNFIQVKARIIN